MSARAHAPAPAPPARAPRAVSRPHDPSERQAERAADVVARGGNVAGWSFTASPPRRVQRQGNGPPVGVPAPPVTNADALGKAGEAALASREGQLLKERILADPLVKRVTDVATTPAGLATVGVALAGGVTALAATGRELPVQPPAIPLDRIVPGLSARVAYKGPVNAPSEVGLTLTFREQGPGRRSPEPTATERIRADTARLRAEDAAFRSRQTFVPGSQEAEEERATQAAIARMVAARSALPGVGVPLIPLPKPAPAPAPAPAPTADAPVQRACACGPACACPETGGHPETGHVDETIAGHGVPLDAPSRHFMEARFGHDFGRVRLHADGRAAGSARALGAAAYAVGDHIVAADGIPSVATEGGRRLLAHELAHVVQHGGAETRVQRDEARPKPAPKPAAAPPARDVVILLAPKLTAEAATLAPDGVVVTATTPEALATKLKALKHPIRTLFVISHALPSGDIGFEDGATTTYVLPSKLATALKGAIPPDRAPAVLDFRGCTVGAAPAAMEQIRAAVGAGTAVGGNCYLVTLPNGPIKLSGRAITKSEQVTARNRADFERGLKVLRDSFGDAKDCVLAPTEASYFAAGGRWVASWYNPELKTSFDVGVSRCYRALTPEKVDPAAGKDTSFDATGRCQLVRIEGKPVAP